MNTEKYQKRLNKEYQSRLAYKLNDLCIMLDALEDVNNGGCCFVAYCIANELFKDGYKDFNLVVYNDEGENFDSLQDIPNSQIHYAIKFQDVVINKGDFDDEYSISDIPLFNPKSLNKHYKRFSWNEIYSKKKNNLIKKTIENYYKDFVSDLYEEQQWEKE